MKFKISENEGRYGFYVRTVDATNRIMVAYDTDGWYWMGMNGARGLIGTADPLTPETWYTAKITYVENDIKLSITDESTGTTKAVSYTHLFPQWGHCLPMRESSVLDIGC